LRGTGAVVGYPVPLALLPAGMGIAQLALRLRQCGLLDGEPVFAADHLDTIIANRDEWLMGLLREQVLQPLDDVSPTSRARLIETLRSWLWNMGDRQAVARELHIHPQTVRYRIDQLREHFGERLNEPRERARLYLALVLGPSGDGR
jgi:DNA-binding PucR family transcriptional regulator